MPILYLKKFIDYFIESKKEFLKYFVLSFLVGLLELCGVALIYPFILRIVSNNNVDKLSAILGGLIILAFIAKNAFMIFYNSLQLKFVNNCEADIQKKLMKYFIYGDYYLVSNISFAKKQQLMGFLTSNSVNNFLLRILNLNVNIFIFVLIIAFLFYKFFTATVITTICAVTMLAIQFVFFKYKTKSISETINKVGTKFNQAGNEALLNTKTIKVLNIQEFFYKKYVEKLDDFKDLKTTLSFYNSIPPYITEPIIIILLLILIAIISYQNIQNPANLLASYALIASAIFRLAPTISRIQVNITGINNSLPMVKELLEYYESIHIESLSDDKETKYKKLTSSIELKDVCYSYDNKNVLNNINLKINKGAFIGITGASGAGKTTLIDILSGLLNIKSGEIYIDGDFVCSPQMPKFNIGYIPQDYNLISASIRENVALGDEINDEKVIEALKLAQIYDYIESNYKDGIYAEPFKDSAGMSQGQKQRISIARALYKDADILILDEATSSLDLKTEDEVCDVLNSLKGNKTIIAVAHRLSTIKNADSIIFMQDGYIKAQGRFEELYERIPEFKELVNLNITNSVH